MPRTDKSLDQSYAEVLDPLVRGAARHHSRWPAWFEEKRGSFSDRVQKVLEERGYAPTPGQFYAAQVQLRQEAYGEEPSDPKAGAAELLTQDEGKGSPTTTDPAPAPKPGDKKAVERKRAH